MVTLDRALNDRLSTCLTVVRTSDGWQASLEVRTGVFSVRVGACPSEAIRDVLGMTIPMAPVPHV